MKKPMTIALSLIMLTGLLSFRLADARTFKFSYPKRVNSAIILSAENFSDFKEEWRGEDYYYISETEDGMMCSILYYKLNEAEKHSLVDSSKAAVGGPDVSPTYPFAYFSSSSNLKRYETNSSNWGAATDDFMFQQNDIEEYEGIKVRQKNMYGYAMIDNDLFVKIHLSKTSFTSEDSIAMRRILSSLKKIK